VYRASIEFLNRNTEQDDVEQSIGGREVGWEAGESQVLVCRPVGELMSRSFATEPIHLGSPGPAIRLSCMSSSPCLGCRRVEDWNYFGENRGRVGRAFVVAKVLAGCNKENEICLPICSMLEKYSRKYRCLHRGLTVILSRCGSRCRWVSCRSRKLAIAKQEKFGCAWFRARSAWTRRQVPSQGVAVQKQDAPHKVGLPQAAPHCLHEHLPMATSSATAARLSSSHHPCKNQLHDAIDTSLVPSWTRDDFWSQ